MFHSQSDALIQELKLMGISDPRVLEAIATVPREQFIGELSAGHAYDNSALPIECGQTISQPYIVALMTQALLKHQPQNVLEIGTGSGYQAAILSSLVDQVVSVERIKPLYEGASKRLQRLHYDNVITIYGDGYLGCQQYAPYDGILVTAATEEIPLALLQQLNEGGALILPVGPTGHQSLKQITRQGEDFEEEYLESVVFVPMLHGTQED